jgi:hypothetical protein
VTKVNTKLRLQIISALALAILFGILYLRPSKPVPQSNETLSASQSSHASLPTSSNDAARFESQQITNYTKLLRAWLGTRNGGDTNAAAAKAVVACRLLENPDAVAYVKSNYLAAATLRIKSTLSPPLWGLEARELQPDPEVLVSANIGSGFHAAIIFPDLPNGHGKVFVEVEGGTDPYIKRFENSASTEGAVMRDGSPDPVAGWCWTNATAPWDTSQAEYWAKSLIKDFGPQMNLSDTRVSLSPSSYAAPVDGENFPALNKQSVRYPFASFKVFLPEDPDFEACGGTFAQTGSGDFKLVEFHGYFNHVAHANPLGDLADKFLSTPGSDVWAQDIVTQAQTNSSYWLLRAMQLIAVRPPPAQ